MSCCYDGHTGQSYMAIQLHIHTAVRLYGHISTSLFLYTTIRIQGCTATWLQKVIRLYGYTAMQLYRDMATRHRSGWLYGDVVIWLYGSAARRLFSYAVIRLPYIGQRPHHRDSKKAITWHIVWRSGFLRYTIYSLASYCLAFKVLYCCLLGRMDTSWHSWYRTWNLWPYGWHQKGKRHV